MKDKLAIIFIIILGLCFYGLTLRGIAGNPTAAEFKGNLDQVTKPLELSPERGRFAGVLALGEYHTYDIGKVLADAVYPDVGYYNGKFFSLFAPGLSYMNLPFYLLGRHFQLSQVFSFGFISLVSILLMVVLYKIAREILKLPVWASLFSVLVFGFATTSWSYAVTLYQHSVTAFFMLSGFYAAWRYGKARNDAELNAENRGKPSAPFRVRFRSFPRFNWFWAVWVWLAYGLAITVDYPNALLMLPVMFYFLYVSFRLVKADKGFSISLRPALLLTAAAFAIVLALEGYNSHVYFGSWTMLSNQLPNYEYTGAQNSAAHPDSAKAVTQISEQKGLSTFFYETNVPFGFYTLTISTDRGLFFFSPILLLAFLGIYKLRKEIGLEIKILLALVMVNVVLYSSWGDPWGGWAFGPRYLIPSMAVLALFVGAWIYRVGARLWAKLAAAVLFAYSAGVALLGALVTNSVPPKIEAVKLPLHYDNYLFDLYLLKQNKAGSFLYNVHFFRSLSAREYYLLILAVLVVVAVVILFIGSRSKNKTTDLLRQLAE